MYGVRDSHTIRTERLVLREICAADADFIVGLRSDPRAYRYFKHPHRLTLEEHEEWYREVYLQNDDTIHWICEKNGARIGVFAAVRVSNSEAEVSYLVSVEHQRKGYAGEALNSIILWVRREWKSDRILAEIHQDNMASGAFIRSLGFRRANREEQFLTYIRDFEK